MSCLVFVACLSIGAGLHSSDVMAQDPPSKVSAKRYDIAAGSLDQVLNQFSLSAGILLSIDVNLTAGKTSVGLAGTYDIAAAFRQLLVSSGLEAAQRSDRQYVLQPVAAGSQAGNGTLPQVTVADSAERDGTTESSGSYTQNGPSRTATGFALSLRETPQSVSVVTQQQMRDSDMQTLDDVAASTQGLTYNKTGTQRSYFYSRGFSVTDLQVDGMSNSIAESYSSDAMSLNNMAIYDRIEVVRGSNGLLQGSGNPSAVINMIRKRPTKEFKMSAEVSAGSWSNYREQLDVSGPINEAGTLRGRAVLFNNTSNGFRNGEGTDNKMIYAIAEAHLSATTTASLGFTAQRDYHSGYDWGGLNTKADGSFYEQSRSTSITAPWAHLNRDNYTLFGDVTRLFDNGWSVTGAFNAVRSRASFLASYPARVSGNIFKLTETNAEYSDRQQAVNLKASGPFTLFGREHQLMLGASSRQDNFDFDTRAATNPTTLDITNFDPATIAYPTLSSTVNHYGLERTERGLYAATRLHATDDLSVILGSRVSWSEYASKGPSSSATFSSGRQLIPYAGVVYDLNKQHSVYLSYTDIYAIQQYYSPTGLLDPVRGKNYEAGIKSAFYDGRLNTSLAVFQADQINLPVAMSVATTCGLLGNTTCYTQGAKVRSRGIDAEITGALTPEWNVAAGVTYSNPEYVAGPKSGQEYNTTVPRKVFKLSTDYRLPGDQWRVGGNLRSQSSMHYDGTGYRIFQGGYALLDLHGSYQYSRNIKLQMNVRNALDKHYYQTIPSANNWGGLYYGDPRTITLTLRYDY